MSRYSISVIAMTKLRPVNLVFAVLLAFSLVTGWWALWGLASGDYFANGSSLVYPTVLGAGIAGGVVGYKVRTAVTRSLVILAALAAISFWLFLPDGWWAKPPL